MGNNFQLGEGIGFIIYKFVLVFLFYYIVKNFSKLSIFNLFILLFFVFFGPSFFLTNEFFDEFSISEVFCLIIAVIFIFFGKYISDEITKKKIKSKSKSIRPARSVNKNILLFFAIPCYVIMFLSLVVYGGSNTLTIIASSSSALTPDELKQMRFDGGPQGWIRDLYAYASGYSSTLSIILLYAYEKSSTKLVKYFIYSFILLNIISGIATLHKSITFIYVLQLILYYALKRKKTNIWNLSLGKSSIVVVVSVLVLIPIYLYLTTAVDSYDALSEILGRVTEEPNRVLREYFICYPKNIKHTLGLNIRILHLFFGTGEYTPAFRNVILQYIDFKDYVGGTWPTIFIADAWVDFSYYGVAVYSVILGYILNEIDLYIKKYNDGLSIVLFCCLMQSLNTLMENSLITTLISGGLLVYPLFIAFITIKKRPSSTLNSFLPSKEVSFTVN